MKKLKLKALELGANELLSREQLKNVMAGDGSGGGSGDGCSTSCTDGQNNHFGCYHDPIHNSCRCPSSGYSCS